MKLKAMLLLGLVLTATPVMSDTVYLGSLDISKITQGLNSPQVDKSVTKKTMAIGGVQFDKGVGTHAPMNLYIKVNGATQFKAQVGIDDNNSESPEASVVFKVIGDSKILWESPLMKSVDKAVDVDVDLAGVKILELVVTDGGDSNAYDQADWANSRFEVTGQKPQALSPMDFGPEKLIPAGQGIKPARTVKLPFEVTLSGPVTDYVAVTSGGNFHREYQIRAQILSSDGFRFEQKAGRSCSGMKPWIMLRSMKTGKGVAGMLGYSGNWVIEVKSQGANTLLRMDSVPSGLKPFTTVGGMPFPGAIVTDFSGEWDNGAIPITRFIRANLVPNQGKDWPLVHWNTWYDDLGYPTEKSVTEGALVAAGMGCEMVVVDAGWYGGKGHWENLCGDWVANQERFPNGLEPVVKKVRSLGLKFGLWTEIESASPDSPVGKAHPDWLLREGDRVVSGRSVLDFGKPEVVQWAKEQIDRLMKDYQLDYIKNDFNTDLPLNSADPKYAQGDPLYAHYRGLDAFWKYVQKKYPKLVIENCSSGSLRHDALTASQSGTHWVSDEVGNTYNIGAVFGATYLFPPETCLHWTCYPNGSKDLPTDLEAQFAVSMMGHLGFSSKIYKWDANAREVCTKQVALYKEIRPVIRNADVYHLTGQASMEAPSTFEAALYVDAMSGKAVLFAFQGGADSLDFNVTLRGLKAKTNYTVRMPNGYGPDKVVKGRDLMSKGLAIKFLNKGASAIVQIEAARGSGG